MCQLSLIHTKDVNFNFQWTITQSLINTIRTNKDGTGVYSGSLVKTELSPHKIINLPEFIGGAMSENPTILHVRLATLFNNKTVVNDKNSHPFESSDLILAHNGSLEPEDDQLKKSYPDMIDSEIFLSVLQEEYEKYPIQTAIVNSMNKFRGKFAFLIYSKRENNYYIVRGRTATLFYSFIYNKGEDFLKTGEPIGIAVNTNKDDLVSGLILSTNTNKINNSWTTFGDPTAIEMETVNILNEFNLKEIGKVKERHKIVKTAAGKAGRSYGNWDQNYGHYNYDYNETLRQSFTLLNPQYGARIREIHDFMEKTDLGTVEIDELFSILYGIPILGISGLELTHFCEQVIPYLETKWSKKKNNIWRRIGYPGIYNYLENEKIAFPYFFNTPSDLKRIKNEIDKRRRENKK